MNKREMFKTLCKSSREEVIEIAGAIKKNHHVVMVKKPSKTLIMLKMQEPVAKAEFFLGELLACEAMVKLADARGMAVTQGDDFEKVLAMAVVDAAYNAGIDEIEWLDSRLAGMADKVNADERKEFGKSMNSKVQFKIMEGQ